MLPRCIAALVLGLTLSGLATRAQQYDQAPSAATPIAYFATASDSTGTTYILFGRNATVNNMQTWEAAEAQCVGVQGHLLSVASDNDNTVATQMNYYLLANGGRTFGSSRLCTWVGASNMLTANVSTYSNTDAADVTYITAKLRNNSASRSDLYFTDDTACAAVCNGAYYLRDCDYEAQSFVCKIRNANQPAMASVLAGAVQLALTITADGTISNPAPAPAYPPTYGGAPGNYTLRNPTNYYGLTFSKCVSSPDGYHYCAATATNIVGQPRTWSEAQTFCNTASFPGLASPFTVATIGSSAELAFILANFPTNASAVGFWTAGVKSAYSKPVFIVPGTANSTWLQTVPLSSTSGIAPPSSAFSPDYASTWSWYGLASSFTGNCLDGAGCGVAITYNAAGSQPGLQLADLGFGMSVLCKASLAKPVASTLNVSGCPAPPPVLLPPCTTYFTMSLTVKMQVNSGRCAQVSGGCDNSTLFSISQTIASAWNAVLPAQPIMPGNVNILSLSTSCYAYDRGNSTMITTAQVSLPSTLSTSQVAALSAASFAFVDQASTILSASAANSAMSLCPPDIHTSPDLSCPALPPAGPTPRINCEVYSAQTFTTVMSVPFSVCASQSLDPCTFKAEAIKGVTNAWNNSTSHVGIRLGDVVITGLRFDCVPMGSSTISIDVLAYLPSGLPIALINRSSWNIQARNEQGWNISVPVMSIPIPVQAPCINTRPAGASFVNVRLFATLAMTKDGCAAASAADPATFNALFAETTAGAWNTSVPATPIKPADVLVNAVNLSTCNATTGGFTIVDFSMNLPAVLSPADVTAALPAFVPAAVSALTSGKLAAFGVTGATLTAEPPRIEATPAPPVTARPPGAAFVKLHLFTTLQLGLENCKAVNASQADFLVQFTVATAAGWNNLTAAKVAPGDVVVTSVRPDCGNGTYPSTLVIAFDLGLPNGVLPDQANATALSFQAAASAAYLTSAFGMSFQISAANVTFEPPRIVKQPFAAVSAKAPGAAYISVNMFAVVNVTTAACGKLGNDTAGFGALFSTAAAAGITSNANFSTAVRDGDVNVTGVSAQCSQDPIQWSILYVNFTVSLPTGATSEQAAAALTAFKASGLSSFNFGALVNTFGVNGVSITFDTPQKVTVPPPPKTPRNEGDEMVSVPLKATMKLSSKACKDASADLAAFTFLYQTATAGAWNRQYMDSQGVVRQGFAKYLIQVGDIMVKQVVAKCGTMRRSAMLRSLLQEAAGSSIDVDSSVQLPPAITLDNTTSNTTTASGVDISAFSVSATDALTTGTFASTYDVSGVTAAAAAPAVTLYQANSSSISVNSTDLGFDPSAPVNVTAPLATTTRSATEEVVSVGVSVKMVFDKANCNALSGSADKQEQFLYLFKKTTAAAWNKANPTKQILAGDVTAAFAAASDISCGTFRLRRALLAASTATTSGSMAMPSGTDTASANSGATAYQAAASSAYTAGMGSQFGVTGAVAVPSAATVSYNSAQISSSSKVALGAGLGVGLGVGIVAIAAAAAVIIMKRRKAQSVAPVAAAAAPAAEAPPAA